MIYVTFSLDGIHYVAQVLSKSSDLLRVKISRCAIDPAVYEHKSGYEQNKLMRDCRVSQGTEITVQSAMCRPCKPHLRFNFPRKTYTPPLSMPAQILAGTFVIIIIGLFASGFAKINTKLAQMPKPVEVACQQSELDQQEEKLSNFDLTYNFAIKKIGKAKYNQLLKEYEANGYDEYELVGDLNTGIYERDHGQKQARQGSYNASNHKGQNDDN